MQKNESINDYIVFEKFINENEFENKFLNKIFVRYEMIQKNSKRSLCQKQIDLIEFILIEKNVFYIENVECNKSTILNCFRQCLKKMFKKMFIIVFIEKITFDINDIMF